MAALQPELAALADVEEPCSIHTFGFGSDQDPKLLQAIAEGANGMYYYIEVRKFFSNWLEMPCLGLGFLPCMAIWSRTGHHITTCNSAEAVLTVHAVKVLMR